MSVIIRGMQKPRGCMYCPFRFAMILEGRAEHYCNALNEFCPFDNMKLCPIEEVEDEEKKNECP